MKLDVPISLYVHLPWCVKKCPYCDFNSHAVKDSLPEENYVDAVIQDLKRDLKWLQNRQLKTIFFGGGTPSLFSGSAISNILTAIRDQIDCDENIEITLEANPGTFDQQHFEDYFAAGVNRLSIGVQSFQDEKLKALGRIHNPSQVFAALENLKKIGFKNFNIDLMYALPTQTIDDALFDLKTALSFSPTHLSWYQLTLEPNTYFYKHPPKLPDEELSWQIQIEGHELLKQAKFKHYEVSAFAQQNLESKHNINYWLFGDYLGIGAGAHSKLTDFNNNKIHRLIKFKHPTDYLNNSPEFVMEQRTVMPSELPFEFMLNALRLNQAIDLNMFTARTGLPIEILQPTLEIAQKKNFLVMAGQKITKTELGKNFLDDLVRLFLLTDK